MITKTETMDDLILTKHKVLQTYNISDDYFILYTLSLYYKLGLITEEKFKGQIKALRAGTLSKTKNTHHCDINDRWYWHESARTIFTELLDDKKNISYDHFLTGEELIKTLMLFTGSNYNFCVTLILDEYIIHMFDRWITLASAYDSDSEFSKYYNLNVDLYIALITDRTECYHCGGSQSNTDYSATTHKGYKKLSEWFHNQKRGRLDKIPRYEL